MTIMTTNALGITLSEPLFSDLNLNIAKGDRIGLVAANGRGKSTLLGCLDGSVTPTTGDVIRAQGTRVATVLQNMPDAAFGHTMYDWVLSALPPEQADYDSWRVDVVLNDLRVPYDFQQKRLEALSGGWQRMAMLARAWITEPDVLLLDEPTNHLDLHHIGMLQDWLMGLPRDLPVVVTSHDRAFLDAVTNRTLFLREEHARVFPLPFSQARAALQVSDAADERRFANDLNKARQLRKQAAKLKNVGINSGSDLLLTKTKQLADRAGKLEAAARPAYREQTAGDIRLGNSGTHAKALITLDDIPVCAPDGRVLYRTGQKWISPGERVVLLGANGTGKTCLVTLIHAALNGTDTDVKYAASIAPGFSDQHLSQLKPDSTPMALLTETCDIGDQRARGLLAGAGITFQMQDVAIMRLSGGQKARLSMLLLRLKSPNFYLLDEPTNHLDIEGQEALEAELISNDAASLVVSHDRRFLQNVGNRFWLINGRTLEEIDSPQRFLEQQIATSE